MTDTGTLPATEPPLAAGTIAPAGAVAESPAAVQPASPPVADDRLSGILDVRRHVARGMLTNGVFQIGLLGLTAARGLVVAAFVTRSDYGLWGLIGLTLWTAMGLKTQFGAGEKYVQQSDANQEHAFQRAFTMELIFTSAAAPIALAAVFGIALATGESRVVEPGLLLLLLLPATALQFPLATFYRRMQFRRQRFLQSVDPVIAAAVTIGLAVAGAGYWSFVIGSLCGAWALAVLIVRLTPYRLKLRYEPGTLRQYVGFSAPLLVTALAVLLLFYTIYLVGNAAIGVAGIGAFTLVGNLVQFTDQADAVVTQTLYPAVCAVQDRVGVLSEIFVKSNRLSLMWAVPFGVGMALFASDLVHFILGTKWLPAVPLLEIMGLVTAVNHVGYNWGAFVKARGKTWPIAVAAVLVTVTTIAVAIPLMYSDQLVGLGIAFAVGGLIALAVRGVWIARFFPGVGIVKQLARAFTPTLLASLPILVGRAVLGPERNLGAAVAVFIFYIAATVAATWLTERRLIREAAGYMLRPRLPGLAT